MKIALAQLDMGFEDKGFVALKNGKKEYYQVTYCLYDQKVIDREFGAYASIPDNYPKYVISMD